MFSKSRGLETLSVILTVADPGGAREITQHMPSLYFIRPGCIHPLELPFVRLEPSPLGIEHTPCDACSDVPWGC